MPNSEKVAAASLKTVTLAFSPLGLALWYGLAGAQDLLVRAGLRQERLLSETENGLLFMSGLLSLAAALLLIGFAIKPANPLLTGAFSLGFGLVLLEIAAVCLSPQRQMSDGLSWGLRSAICIHTLLALALYGHCIAQSYRGAFADKR